jgi:hypothetical protein
MAEQFEAELAQKAGETEEMPEQPRVDGPLTE